jgi:nitronate monooxygenase
MMETRITRLFRIEHPVIGGCMQWITGPEFTAAVSNAGGLGVMSSASFVTQEEFREALRKLKRLTDKPFAVNLNLFPALRPIDNRLYVEAMLEEGGVPVVETSGGRPPAALVKELKDNGVLLMHKCTTVHHAEVAQDMGYDAVTVFGSEGGGHIGEADLTFISLVPRAVERLRIPVIAAGGIADGRGLAAALALGAEAVLIGTRLLLAAESPVHEAIKERLLEAEETDTIVILGSVHNRLRVWRNRAAQRAAELEAAGAAFDEIIKVVAGSLTRDIFRSGDPDGGIVVCSQGVGLVHEVKPVAGIIRGMVEEAERATERLLGMVKD